MREELEYALAQKFDFMKRRSRNRTGGVKNLYQDFGVETLDGWYQLLHDLCEELAKCIHDADVPVKFVVTQIKEKNGTLRFYYYLEDDDFETREQIDEIIDKYEGLSATICECCGKTGKLQDKHGQLVVRCEECFEKMK
ncbi:MAG: hypothetical protein ACI39H_00510 [Lachnospiraceae bacterium]